MSFNLSAGTLDTMSGIFCPSKKHRSGSGGGSLGAQTQGGTVLGFAVASTFPKASPQGGTGRPLSRVKQVFGGGTQAAASRRAISAIDRTARRTPEVMVRITGRQHGGGHVLANFVYICRLGHGPDKELALFTSDGEVLRDARDMQELAHDWHEWEMGDDARRKGATSLSMILSMPKGTDPERLKAAGLDFAQEEFANRSWVASLHVDRDHPHVHLTIARRDHDGRRFHPNRDDLFRYRQRFAQKLRDRGIEANATPAKARGIDPRHEHISALKIRAKGQVPRLDRSRAARAERVAGTGATDPVQTLLNKRHSEVRAAYECSIAELRASPSIINQAVATNLQRFLDGLNEPQPNSIQAARMQGVRVVVEPSAALTATHDKEDPVVAALARSKATRNRIEARRTRDERRIDQAKSRCLPASSMLDPDVQSRTSSTAERSSIKLQPDGIDDVMRQMQDRERDRLVHDRNRDPDRGGPKR
ncbi:relaxase/mobilization nuclease domain-containing protein [Sphingomonas sp. GM_Shp_2]|uniref:relaxase/mobilization nuclease domain-containing protein n=1 Tax=Sphingomonas sp. GM_Shp_2 TaxID=2937380 RepID=UPI00226A57C7|nr:relaxase/mobilization nuclease domain-containing protein [Sphingomonas sp. GM_Shp_2]